MNKINFKQTGGFPLDTNVLDFMQNAYGLFNAIGEIAGNLAILKGCTVTGNTVSDGIVFINGQILQFKQSTGTKVIIREEKKAMQFEDGNSKDIEIVRYAALGTGSVSWNWSDFVRIDPMKEVQKKVVPIGLISMWSGVITDIPDGWVLCDGNNGTPDLRDRFIVGTGVSYNTGDKGGKDKLVLTVDNMPTHSHNASISTDGSHRHAYKDVFYSESHGWNDTVTVPGNIGSHATDDDNRGLQMSRNTDYEGSHSHTVTIGKTGSSQAFDNRPSYYALTFIMFKG